MAVSDGHSAEVPSVDTNKVDGEAATSVDLWAPLEDDGTVELALMASEHPEVKRFGSAIFDHSRTLEKILNVCKPWHEAGDFPIDVLDTYQSVQDIERLDSIDLTELRPEWGDKATVRMARKGVIGYAEKVMERLDALQALLKPAVLRLKQQRSDAVKATPEKELSLQEKYRDKFEGPPVAEVGPMPGSGSRTPNVARKRTRPQAPPATASEVEALLWKVQQKVGKQLQKRPLAWLGRQLANWASVPDLADSPPLCRSSIECALNAVLAALGASPQAQVLGQLLTALQEIESLKDPSGLPAVLLDLSDTIKAL